MSDDIHALSGAYAVDALDDVERAHFEQHLAACAACRNEVDSLREGAALLAETTPTTPSPELRTRVLTDIGMVRPLPPVIEPNSGATAQPYAGTHRADPADSTATDTRDGNVTHLAPRRRRRAASFLAAAAAVVAIGTGGVIWQQLSDDGAPSNVAAAVMSAPDHQTYTQKLDNGATATVYRSEKLNEAVLVTRGFPDAPSGSEFALWLQHDGTMVPAGVLPHRADNQIVLSGDAATASGAGITVEPAGTEPTTPSGDTVASIAFQET